MEGHHIDDGALGGRKPSSHFETRFSQGPKPPRHNQHPLDVFKSETYLNPQRQQPADFAAQRESTENVRAGRIRFNPEAPSYIPTVHRHEQTAFAHTTALQETRNLQRSLTTPPPMFDATGGHSAPRKVYRSRELDLGPRSSMYQSTTSLMNARSNESVASFDTVHPAYNQQMIDVLQNSSDDPTMYSDQESIHSRPNNSQSMNQNDDRLEPHNNFVRDGSSLLRIANSHKAGDYQQQQEQTYQVGLQKAHTRLGPYRRLTNPQNFSNENEYQQRLESLQMSPTGNLRSSSDEQASFRKARGDSLRQHSFGPAHYSFISRYQDENSQYKCEKGDELTRLSSFALISKVDTGSLVYRDTVGLLQPPDTASSFAQDRTSNEEQPNSGYASWALIPSRTGHSESPPEPDLFKTRAHHVEDTLAKIIPVKVQRIAAAVQEQIDELVQHHQPGFLGQFRPSNSALKNVGLLEDGQPRTSPDTYGSSNNYQGDITVPSNRSANIPDGENCAVWVLGLPAYTSHADFLGSFRNIGKIYACVINAPTDQHHTSAAKVVFFERFQAANFVQLVLDRQLVVLGKLIRHVRWNKVKSARYPHSSHSRAITITGDSRLMDFGFFEVFFTQRFTYELEARRKVYCDQPGKTSHEWRFGSLRCQSASAKTSIERELKNIFAVEWAHDPCL